EIFNSYSPYEDRIGRKYRILITEEASDKSGNGICHYVGHNEFYEQILVPKDQCTLGSLIDVEIVSFGKHYMVGRLVSTWLAFLEDRQTLGRFWLSASVIVLCSSLLYNVYRHL